MEHHQVFISYSSEDKVVADAICHELEHQNIPCWIAPRDVQPGARYGAEIIKAINNCQLVVLVFSAKSNMSDHVANEVDKAFNAGKTIIPFLIDSTKMNEELEYYLSRKHWLAAYPHYKEHLERLTVAVANVLNIEFGKASVDYDIDKTSIGQDPQSSEIDLHINIDVDCLMYCFGKLIQELSVNVDNVIRLKPGTYQFEFESKDYPDIKQSLRYKVLPDTTCDIIDVKMQERVVGENKELRRIKRGDLYGYENIKSQEIVIPCKWKDAGEFSEGLAYVQDGNEKYGYIDKKGKLVIPCKWMGAGTFCENLTCVMDTEEKWGYINKMGELIIPCEWEDAMGFCEGRARVQDEDSKWGFINKTGELVIPCEWEDAEDFSGGRAHVQDEDLNWGYINKDGEIIVECSEWDVDSEEFSEGLAAVCNIDGKYGFIDKMGKLVIPCVWDYAENFCEGFAQVVEEKRNNIFSGKKWKYGFINKTGRLISPCKWKYVEDFDGGYAYVKDENEDWGFINETGEFFMISGKWDVYEFEFSEGLASVKDGNEKYGYIDKTGKLVIPCEWEDADDFSGGLACVKDKNGKGYKIDRNGKIVSENED